MKQPNPLFPIKDTLCDHFSLIFLINGQQQPHLHHKSATLLSAKVLLFSNKWTHTHLTPNNSFDEEMSCKPTFPTTYIRASSSTNHAHLSCPLTPQKHTKPQTYPIFLTIISPNLPFIFPKSRKLTLKHDHFIPHFTTKTDHFGVKMNTF